MRTAIARAIESHFEEIRDWLASHVTAVVDQQEAGLRAH